ncbi:hypothetical protein ACIQU3_29505 [Streptomyces sp. NPDC101110]
MGFLTEKRGNLTAYREARPAHPEGVAPESAVQRALERAEAAQDCRCRAV